MSLVYSALVFLFSCWLAYAAYEMTTVYRMVRGIRRVQRANDGYVVPLHLRRAL